MNDQTAAASVIRHEILPRTRDLGGFEVRRVLPAAERRMVGPFVFFDQMGPVEFSAGRGIDVRPHPHIGLSTVTYLFAGSIVHRDTSAACSRSRPATSTG
jgi:redox-sensitive bicupin YhaK (pirin superfamily)